MTKRILNHVLGLTCVVTLLGCGTSYDTAPVAGRVTLDGQPLPGAQITFQPASTSTDDVNPGPGSYGKTDGDGRYQLRLVEPDGDGAVVGQHHVWITTDAQDNLQDDAGGVSDTKVPPQYRDGSVTFEVPAGGTDAADFELVTQP